MALPQIVSRDEWLTARKAFLAEEKAFTQQRDALNTSRRQLPMVEIDTAYTFTGPEGETFAMVGMEGLSAWVVDQGRAAFRRGGS